MRVYFPSILALAQSVLRSPEPCMVSFGGNMYLHSFAAFDSYCQQVVFCYLAISAIFLIQIEDYSTIWNAVLCLAGGGGLPGDPCVLWCGWGGGHISGAPLWSGERKTHRNGSTCCFCQGTVIFNHICVCSRRRITQVWLTDIRCREFWTTWTTWRFSRSADSSTSLADWPLVHSSRGLTSRFTFTESVPRFSCSAHHWPHSPPSPRMTCISSFASSSPALYPSTSASASLGRLGSWAAWEHSGKEYLSKAATLVHPFTLLFTLYSDAGLKGRDRGERLFRRCSDRYRLRTFVTIIKIRSGQKHMQSRVSDGLCCILLQLSCTWSL